MRDIVKFFDNLPFILKLIFALPGIDGIAYGIYRIAKGKLLFGIIWLIFGWAILWIIDLVSVVMNGKVTYFA